MGNAAANYFSLYIDRPRRGQAVVAGSTVTGMVRVHVPTEGNFTIPEGGRVLFTGKEDVCVRYKTTTGSGDNRRTVTRRSYSTRDIVRMAIRLEYPSNMIHGGNFQIPFQFQLPDQLPSSFAHGSGSWCKIRYKVKLDINKREIPIVVVAKPPSSQPIPSLVEPITTPITLCCCIPRGKIILGANADDTRVGQGEKIKIDLGVKNNSTAEFEFISAKIHQCLSWHSKGHSASSNRYLGGKQFNLNHDNMRAISKDEVLEKQNAATATGTTERNRSLELSDDECREILAAIKDGRNQVVLQIPASAINTYHGSLIKVSHHLLIKAKTPSWSTNPTIKVPLQIVSPQSAGGQFQEDPEPMAHVSLPTAYATPINPEGWNADNVTTVAPSLPSAISYGGNVVDSTQETDFEDFDLPPIAMALPMYDYPSLLKEIQSSLIIRTKLQNLLKNDQWKAVIVELTPNQFLEIISKVDTEFDKVDVIEMLAGVVKNFTCAYAARILRKVRIGWLRIQTVQKMIPHCTDLETNKSVLLNELSDWERISTEQDFAK